MVRLRKNQIILIAVAAVLVIGAIIGGVALAKHLNKVDEPAPEQGGSEITENAYYAPLTGAKIEAEIAKNTPVIAVMIPNSTQYRTQSGLYEAEIVYEAIANGGIPRLMALYQANHPELIGPVRSLRLQYIDLFMPYQASIAYSGAAAYVLNAVSGKRDIGANKAWSAYYREEQNGRPLEYTMYTTYAKLAAANAAKGYGSSDFTAWARADEPTKCKDAASSDCKANHIKLGVARGTYEVIYDYDAATQTYKRSWGDGVPHRDREKGQLAPSVVVAMRTQQHAVSDDREDITLTGTGEAVIFQQGQAISARWSKEGQSAELKFYDPASGSEIVLARGQTWVSLIPNNNKIEWRQ
ncbi:MAG: DUF3048 domain-containing protein [Candidatus Nomurabacteria bacterium]|jgi:hypothetical protein|nr:DUF3048 domain-containing protein [Candidatus Nomurabacteria bacterium]